VSGDERNVDNGDPERSSVEVLSNGSEIRFLFTGDFSLRKPPPQIPVLPDGVGPEAVVADGTRLGTWDSALLIRLREVAWRARRAGSHFRLEGFPENVVALADGLFDAAETPEKGGNTQRGNLIERIGGKTIEGVGGMKRFPTFLGETFQSVLRLFRGKAVYQKNDLLALFWENSGRSIGIVFLITVLTGLIMAFVGAIQLSQFGANIFVADLVALAMFREMGAMMAAIILAGRTGSAFAAQIGSMKANDELNALRTMGVSPFDFIVLPRLITLILMMPVLAFLGAIAGVLGGMFVTVGFMDVTATAYLRQTAGAIGGTTIFAGIVKSFFFGAIIALTGCYRGLNAGSSAESVGRAATSAVVTSIVWIIVADAVFAVLFFLYGI